MSFEVFFSKRAEKDFDQISDYIDIKFGPDSVKQFNSLIIHFVALVQSTPEIGSVEQKTKGIRYFVAHSRLKIFYRIKGNKIIILRLFDTRQHPNKTKE